MDNDLTASARTSLSRRNVLAGLGAVLPAAAGAETLRPRLRGTKLRPPDAIDIVRPFGLGPVTGFSLRDLSSGRILSEHQAGMSLPPASVAKALTTLYALDAMGPGYRFRTEIAITGRIAGGVLEGDLYLIGGGDPTLDTDRLAELAQAVAAAGIRRVAGRAYVVGSDLPYLPNIDPGQPAHVGYNPAISGLNLNFNRVHFRWNRAASGYAVELIAAGKRYAPRVSGIQLSIADRKSPIFAFRDADGRDQWSVAAGALGKTGARWLPVRRPAAHAGEVFRLLAAQFGVAMPGFVTARRAPSGGRLAQSDSPDCARLLRDMMKYSTNLTAEVAGLRASQRRGQTPATLESSGRAMSAWVRSRFGLRQAALLNHSGLTDKTRMTAGEMVQLLDIAAMGTGLDQLMKTVPLTEAERSKTPLPGVTVRAKTGTLYFTRGLAGYIDRGGRRLAFAIFAADLNARKGFTPSAPGAPKGS
ncbi:MAG: D-alanyl-D-alanine carboxypeptidase/D-alanyl-D-alanine-endopeptidase, partial [Pseudomonadota bacterium]